MRGLPRASGHHAAVKRVASHKAAPSIPPSKHFPFRCSENRVSPTIQDVKRSAVEEPAGGAVHWRRWNGAESERIELAESRSPAAAVCRRPLVRNFFKELYCYTVRSCYRAVVQFNKTLLCGD